MKSQTSLICCVAFAVTAASSSFAVEAQAVTTENVSSSPLYFPNLDKNHDGSLSRSEVPKELRELRVHFDRYDTNQDHRISAAEYSAYLNSVAGGGQGACNNGGQQATNAACDSNNRGQSSSQMTSPPMPAPLPSSNGR